MSVAAGAAPSVRPPAWFIVVTAAMAALLLALAVAETSLKTGAYFIDQGEYLSLFGLGFVVIAGWYLHRRGQLYASLPLVFPWLLYPVITQGDQIIDNLSINWMRLIVHVLLAAIFAMPVAVVVMGTRYAMKLPPGSAAMRNLTIALLIAEMWLAYQYLGWLMIIALVAMIAIVVLHGVARERGAGAVAARRRRTERAALVLLLVGVAGSALLYVAFKNRPGAYQGSPSFYMDPSQATPLVKIEVAVGPTPVVVRPASPDLVKDALSAYADTLQKLLDGYYILDRNYNYHFHNELFLRSTALLPNYRAAGLGVIEDARRLRADADRKASVARATLAPDDPFAALVDDVRAFVAFNFERAATLERMSAEFERTKAGLQHATHIYEGEGKFLGIGLANLVQQHHAVLAAPAVATVVAPFVTKSGAIHDKYANRIVGF